MSIFQNVTLFDQYSADFNMFARDKFFAFLGPANNFKLYWEYVKISTL